MTIVSLITFVFGLALGVGITMGVILFTLWEPE